MGKKLTIEYVKEAIESKNPTIKILSDEYHGNKSKLHCQCLICDYEWDANYNSLSSMNSKCAKCSGIAMLSVSEVQSMLDKRKSNIIILTKERIRGINDVECKCLICGTIFNSTWKNISFNKACPNCSKTVKLTLDKIKDRLYEINKNIEILSTKYTNNKTKLECKCKVCNHIWGSKWNDLQTGYGCPSCGNNLKLTISQVKERLSILSPNIIVLSDEYDGCEVKLDVMCSKDGHVWKSSWANLSQKSGCPKCGIENSGWNRSSWVKKGKSSTRFLSFKLYIIRCFSQYENFYKIGITFIDVENRYHSKKSMPYNYEIVKIIESEDGAYIWNLEKELHRKHKKYEYTPNINFAGHLTECFSQLIPEEVDSLG